MLVFRADVPDEVKRKRAPRRRQPIKKGMRPIGPTVGNELRLRKVVNGIVMNAASFTREHGLPITSSLKEQMSVDHMMRDDTFQLNSFMDMLRNYLEQQTSQLPRWLRPIFESEEQNHRSNFTSSVKTTFGIDISSVVRSSDVQPQLDLAMSQSVNLITGMTDELAKRVQTVLTTSAIQGKRADETASMMSDQFGWSLKRSKLIARDQMATFNGVLNKVRQTQNGFDKYIWSTSQDERVRPEHAAREGKIYSWDNPPEDGNPGEPINCRCVARAYVDVS
jgi:SPP1 gp7 family putative phage head morphogenesis protein